VQRIIRAYDEHKNRVAEEQLSLLESKNGKSNTVGPVVQPEADASSDEAAIR
jgi:hypothetical protein